MFYTRGNKFRNNTYSYNDLENHLGFPVPTVVGRKYLALNCLTLGNHYFLAYKPLVPHFFLLSHQGISLLFCNPIYCVLGLMFRSFTFILSLDTLAQYGIDMLGPRNPCDFNAMLRFQLLSLNSS